MTYSILVESAPGLFTPTGETYTGDEAGAQQHVTDRQAEDGRCYSAQAMAT